MPYVLVSTQIRLECGPTVCGDEHSDPELMNYLGAKLVTQLGNNFPEYRCPDPPRVVLNKLEKKGYKAIGMTGIGQTCIWTTYKPDISMERLETETQKKDSQT
ncbi:GTP cyclohydrolase 1 feedback regulatory protein-like isoform X1 [Glandiceps talaboti]